MKDNALYKNPLVLSIVASIVVTALLALVWKFTPLADMAGTDEVIGWFRGVSGTFWAPLAIVFAHLVASIVMFPRPLLTIAAVVAFGMVWGFAYSMLGVLISAAAGWYAGRLFDEKRIKRMAGPRLAPMTRMLKKEGLIAVTLVRLLPVAPFTVESVVAGALRVKLWHLVVGTALGMLPGMLGTTILGDQLAAAITQGRQINHWIIVGAVAAMLALFFFTHRWYKRMEAEFA
jgi:phospholipase D1/2